MAEALSVAMRLGGADPADVEELHLALRDDLRQLDGVSVRSVPSEAPPGAKAVPGIDWNTLVLSLAASGGVLTTLLGLVQSRLTRDRTVTLEVEGDKLVMTGVSNQDQERLIQAWVMRRRYSSERRG